VVVPVVVVAVVVVDVVDVVVVVVVVVVPAAYADATPSAARATPMTRDQTPSRIVPVCRTLRLLAQIRRMFPSVAERVDQNPREYVHVPKVHPRP
jgi:hypothetical protein